jgi:hypothetical protein
MQPEDKTVFRIKGKKFLYQFHHAFTNVRSCVNIKKYPHESLNTHLFNLRLKGQHSYLLLSF